MLSQSLISHFSLRGVTTHSGARFNFLRGEDSSPLQSFRREGVDNPLYRNWVGDTHCEAKKNFYPDFPAYRLGIGVFAHRLLQSNV